MVLVVAKTIPVVLVVLVAAVEVTLSEPQVALPHKVPRAVPLVTVSEAA